MKKIIPLVKEIVIITGIVIIIGFSVNYFSSSGIALFGSWDPERGVITANAKNDTVVRDREIADIKIVKEIYDAGDTLFIDARTQVQYEQGHIKGSVSLPLRQFDDRIEQFFEKYPANVSIITYCSGRECRDSHDLAQQLIDAGYENTRVYIDGYPSWKKEGYPVE